jgi:RNA polymerase I-specific transcription initiation factor RRN3
MLSVAQPAMTGSMAAPPLKSALKRKHSDISEPEENNSQELYSSKRVKVQFNEQDNKTEIIKAWDDDKALVHVREEVHQALDRHLEGDSSAYDSLRELLTTKPFADDALSNTLLRRYIIALTGFTSLMGKRCAELVEAVLEIQWLGRDEDTVVCYRRLLVNLIATHGGFAQTILSSLVDKFVNCRPLSRFSLSVGGAYANPTHSAWLCWPSA